MMKKFFRGFYLTIILIGLVCGPLCANIGGCKASGAALRTEKNQARACIVCQSDFFSEFTKWVWGCPEKRLPEKR